MAQTGYTPVLLYGSTTTGNTPLAANLTTSASGVELAINAFDGKLFYKDAGGTVQVLATKGTAAIGGSNTQVQYNSSGSLAGSANMTFDGTTLTAAGLAGPHNGTVGATTPNTGAFTTLSASSTVTLSGGTANGVAYLNGSKVVTTGSALTFDGTNFATTGTISGTNHIVTGGSASGNSMYLATTNAIGWSTNGSERMRLDSSGNLGLGVTPSAWSGAFNRAMQIGSTTSLADGSGYTLLGNNWYYNGGNKYLTTAAASRYYLNAGMHIWETAPSGTAGNAITFTQAMTLDASGNLAVGSTSVARGRVYVNSGASVNALAVQSSTTGVYLEFADVSTPTWSNSPKVGAINNDLIFSANGAERARIDSSGNLLVGKTSTSDSVVGFQVEPSSGRVTATSSSSTSANNTFIVYSTGVSAYRFYVGLGGTINATNTTITAISDQRLKENIRDLDDGLATVMSLKPRKFDWKENKGKGIKNDRGFIAQEFEQVLPDMVEEWLDPAPEGEEPYKAVNANLIPTLVKAIQEQQAIIEQLKADVAALKGN